MFTFASLWWLLALPLPFLVWRWLRRRAPRKQPALFHPHAQLLAQLAAELPVQARRWPWLWLTGCMLLVLALARPQWVIVHPYDYPGRDLMFAIDVSGSMRAEDFVVDGHRVNRLDMVKAIVDRLLAQRPGDRAGLIVFGDDAFTLTPVTRDLALVRSMLHDIKNGIAGERTAMGDAIALAVKRLRDRPRQARVLFLFTDGTNTAGRFSPEDALELAKQYKVRIYTVGIGQSGIVAYPGGPSGGTIASELPLDQTLLQQIATETGGRYYRVKSSDDAKAILADIKRLETVDIHLQNIGEHFDWYWLPLALGLMLLFLAQRRSAREVLP
ncbi:MAG: VWA domain-containing protein [Gammaproteobacteria bacterium]|jgi:Ca-activated chloride channel family protein